MNRKNGMTTAKTKKTGLKKKTAPVKRPHVPSNWFYMSQSELGISDVKAALDETNMETELWEELGVLEIILTETGSMDVETIENDFEDAYSLAFLEEHQIKSLFYVTIKPETYETAKPVMEGICQKIGGFFCGDTEDFTPIVPS